jgi:hypothetical protein
MSFDNNNNTSVSEIQMRQARLVEQNKARLRDAVRTSEDSAQIGRESLVTMHDQGKQLERVNHSLDEIDVNLNRAERVLRSLTFWGRVRNFFTLDRTGRAWKYVLVEGKSTAAAAAAADADEHVSAAPATNTKAIASAADEEEAMLEDMLANSVGDLKQIALTMSSELDAHNALLAEANAKAERSRNRTKQASHKTWLLI